MIKNKEEPLHESPFRRIQLFLITHIFKYLSKYGKSYFGRKDKMPVGKNVENKNEGVGGDL
jgi:hypothetical protein